MEWVIGSAGAQRRLRVDIGGYGQTRDSADDGDRHDPRSQPRNRVSHRDVVPFVVRQPATSNYVY
jgi:hypothetical protein